MQITFEKQELVPKTSDQQLLISDYSALLTNLQSDRCLLYVNMWIDSTIVGFIEWRCFHILIWFPSVLFKSFKMFKYSLVSSNCA